MVISACIQVRTKLVTANVLPGLVVALTLHPIGDVIAFMSTQVGLLLFTSVWEFSHHAQDNFMTFRLPMDAPGCGSTFASLARGSLSENRHHTMRLQPCEWIPLFAAYHCPVANPHVRYTVFCNRSPEQQLVKTVATTAESVAMGSRDHDAAVIMRVVCSLGGLGSILLTKEEALQSLKLMEVVVLLVNPSLRSLKYCQVSHSHSRVAELGLCFLLTSPSLAKTLGSSTVLKAWEVEHLATSTG